jgi:hypothetical protein
MRLAGLVAATYAAFDVPAAMADVAALAGHDRYQAAAGLHDAAALVAARADAAGLREVETLTFPADGGRRWWTFAGPRSWTPVRATLRAGDLALRYPEQPYALAANSAAVPGSRLPVVRWTPHHRPDPTGALVLLDPGDPSGATAAAGFGLSAVLGALVAGGAAGVVVDALAGRAVRWAGQVGRVELPGGCPLFAFSVTPDQFGALAGVTEASVLVETDPTPGTFPVVTGVLRGDHGPGGDGELWLTAHLCHPRPSANDNASGVAALLGIARAAAVTATPAGRTVRFVWGPEFVGTVAYLRDATPVPPVAAVNVDMAGEDQRRCGGPLIVERAPDELPSPLSAVAERCAELMPSAGRSYSGAVPCDTWSWRATPYVGASDHAMLAGPPTNCPAVSLGHWPDLANHTSADTLDLVDPDELRRTATIAGATVAALRAMPHDPELAADVTDAVLAWGGARILSALPHPRPPHPGRTPPDQAGPGRTAADQAGPVLDPFDPDHAAGLVRHRADAAVAAAASLRGWGVPACDADRAAAWLTDLATLTSTRAGPPTTAAPPGATSAATPGPATGALVACWEGPLNLRHLGEVVGADDRRWLDGQAAADRGGSYARLLALARGVDGTRDAGQVAWWAARASELTIPASVARRFIGMLCEAGWVRPAGTTGEA